MLMLASVSLVLDARCRGKTMDKIE